MIKDAKFSKCKKHRYLLRRIWDDSKPLVGFIGLNPSTADAETDDQTIRRCIGFAKLWGYGGIYMVNLFSYRATDPREMKKQLTATSYTNNIYLLKALVDCKTLVACWGNHGAHQNMGDAVIDFLQPTKLKCLGTTVHGMPKHPVRLACSTRLVNYP